MTKTDFAELKEKLCYFDSQKNYNEILTETLIKNPNRDSKELVVVMYSGARNAGRNEQNTKSAVIISELIEIIKSQSEVLEYYLKGQCCWIDGTINIAPADKSLSETTTRLQKLRDGKI